jgi:putative transposase
MLARKAVRFGRILEGKTRLNETGGIADRCWRDIPKHFPNVELDEFVVMPNHIHGIIVLTDDGRDVQFLPAFFMAGNVPTRISPKRGSLSVIVRTFKGAVTTECRRRGYNNFAWQSRFYEHIIRDDKDLENIREYIRYNPMKWLFAEENPDVNRL